MGKLFKGGKYLLKYGKLLPCPVLIPTVDKNGLRVRILRLADLPQSKPAMVILLRLWHL